MQISEPPPRILVLVFVATIVVTLGTFSKVLLQNLRNSLKYTLKIVMIFGPNLLTYVLKDLCVSEKAEKSREV